MQNILYLIDSVLSYKSLSSSQLYYTLSISMNFAPKNYSQAIKFGVWREEMATEIKALEANYIWTLVNLPPDKASIRCKWVYKIKYKAHGTIERYKARLVAKGYTQTEGIDFFDTFSLVVKMTTITTLLALAAIHGWQLQQIDVNNAFLHGDLHEELYMILPLGFQTFNHHQVCRLQKSLYGLK